MDKVLLAPVCLFVYNRPEETQRTLNALLNNNYAKDSDLFIFSDAARNQSETEPVKRVREIISVITGFKSVAIVEADKNKGLANSIIDGVTSVVNKYGKTIVLEDDLITSPNFLSYMNQSLDFYQDNKQIISISGCTYRVTIPDDYLYDVYFTHRMSSYGWATWKDRWNTVDWEMKDYKRFRYNLKENFRFMRGGDDLPRMLSAYMKGKINSWAIRFCYHQYKTNTYSVYPIESKVDNIGYNQKATHTQKKKRYDVIEFKESTNESFQFAPDIHIHPLINKSFLHKYRTLNRIIANYMCY